MKTPVGVPYKNDPKELQRFYEDVVKNIRDMPDVITDTTGWSATDAGYTTLSEFTIPAGKMLDYSMLRITAAGWKSGSNGNKSIDFYFGSYFGVPVHAAANNTTPWKVEILIVASTNAYADFSIKGYDGTTLIHGYTGQALVWSEEDIDCYLRANLVSGSDQLYQYSLLLEYM